MKAEKRTVRKSVSSDTLNLQSKIKELEVKVRELKERLDTYGKAT